MNKNSSSPSPSRRALNWRASISHLRASATALAGLSALILGATIAPRAQAANDAFSTNPNDNTFTGINWTLGTTTPGAPTGTIASGDALYFGTSTLTTLNENEAAGFSIASFTFNAGAAAFTIGGNSFALGAGGITNNGTNLETINDAFTMAATSTFTTTAGGGNLALGGAISGAGGMTFGGGGTTTLSGALSYTGATTLNGGVLTLNSTGTLAAAVNVSQTAGNTSTLNLASTGTLTTVDVLVGAGAGSTGVVNQTTGTLTQGAGNQLVLASGSTSAFAGYNLSGGTLNIGTVRAGGIGASAEGNSLFTQTGGTFTAVNYFLNRNSSGMNQIYLNGAGAAFTTTGAFNIGYAGSGTAVATVNAGTLTSTNALNFGNNGYTGTSILNLDGGIVRAPSLVKNAGTAILNFNGGTLRASGASGTFLTGLNSANVYAGGARIDTNGFAITIAQPLLTTAGTGVTTIPITGGGSYLTAPLVSITGGGGTGATAVANLTNGVITSFTITSPGTGYTGTPTVTLIGGGPTTAATLGAATTGTNPADGGLTKIGLGTLTLTGANTYTGGTTVNAGTLQLGFTAAGSNILASGGALTLSGGTFNVNTTATTGANSQTLGNLTISGGANTISTTTSGATNTLTFTGTLTHNAGSVDFVPAGTTSITLSNAANQGQAFLGDYAFFGTGTGETYAGTSAAGVVQAATLTNATGVNAFTSATGAYNYVSPGSPDQLTANRIADAAFFNTASAQTIDLNGANTLTLNSFLVTGGALTILNSGTGGTLTIGGNSELLIGGGSAVNIAVPIINNGGTASALTDSNTGTLTLSGTNTYTGVTTISNGTLTIGGAGTLGGGTYANTITDNGAFIYNSTAPQALSGVISGTGTLTQSGAGTLTLSGANTYTGTTAIGAGSTLTVGGAGTLGGGTYANTITDNGVFNYNSTAAQTISGVISGTGALTQGAGSLTLTGVSTYTGGTIVSGGTLTLGVGGAMGTVRGVVTVSSGATLNLSVGDALGYNADGTQVTTLNVNGGTVNNSSNANEGFSTNLNLTGGTVIGGGFLRFNNATAGSFSITSNASGITSTIAPNVDAFAGPLNINVATGTTASGIDLSITGAIISNSIVKTGSGYLNLAGQNTFTGPVNVTAGTLNVGTGGTGTTSALGADNTTKVVTVSSGATLSGTINNWFGTGTQNNGATPPVSTLPTITLNGGALTTTRYTAIGALNLNAATVTASAVDAGNYQAFAFRGNVTVGGTAASTITSTNVTATTGGYHLGTNTTFTVATTGSANPDLTVSAPLINQSGDFGQAAGGLTKAGPGVMLLTATNTYTGPTAISAGTLLVNGSTVAGSAVAVNGGVLGGTGTAAGPVTVNAGGTINPGPTGAAGSTAAVGTLRVGALTLSASTSGLAFDLNATASYDKLVSSGAVNLALGSFTANIGTGTFNNGDVLTLISGTSLTPFNAYAQGAVVASNGTFNFTADYTTTANAFDLDVTPVPEPSTWLGAVMLVGLAGVTQRRKINDWLKTARV